VGNAAPFIASPVRRLIAGVVDFVVLFLLMILVVPAIAAMAPRGISVELGIGAILALYGMYHAVFFFLFEGATPGQRAFDMRIVSVKGSDMSFRQGFLRAAFRPALLFATGAGIFFLPHIPGVIAVVLAAPLLLEAGMMFTSPWRQTLADLVCGTLVINVPPPQPHRAPAGPMYSATDAEFGVRPQIRR